MTSPNISTIPQLLSNQTRNSPDKEFLVFKDQSLTYLEVDRRSAAIASHLQEMGIRQGDHVAFFLPNCPDFILAWFALAKLGAVMVPINPSYKSEELAYILSHSASKLCLTNKTLLPEISKITNNPIPILLTNQLPQKPTQTPNLTLAEITSETTMSILYTSGTTGQPKGVILPHRSYTIGGESFAMRAKLSKKDRVMIILPLFHVNAQIYSVIGSLVVGATIILIDHFSASTFWKTILKHEVTQFNFLGVIANILLKQPALSTNYKHKVRLACGAGLSKETIESFINRFSIPLLETYGLTEAPMGTSNLPNDYRYGSIGRPSRHPNPNLFTQLRLIGKNGHDVAQGETGEIILKTPVLSPGYYKNTKATEKAFKNGWFYTGDLGKQDADGYYYFLDRKKDIIRKKGENISSREIEKIIAGMPEVTEVAVIPIPAPLGEDDIKAIIVTKPGAKLTHQDVKKHTFSHLSPQKVPAIVEFVTKLPKTPTSKIAKNKLKSAYLEKISKLRRPVTYLVDGLRTPFAKFAGAYNGYRPDEMLAHCLTTLKTKNQLDKVDDVIVGCVNQAGESERNIARQAVLLSSLNFTTPAVTVSRLSASGLESARLAHLAIKSKASRVVIAAGVESFSRAPFILPRANKNSPAETTPIDSKLGWNFLHPKLKDTLRSSGDFAETLAKKEAITRADQDSYAIRSNERALFAADNLQKEITPFKQLDHDEVPRPDITLKRLQELEPLYSATGTITAGNASKLADGAAVALIASKEIVKEQRWKPLAGLVGFSLIAVKPENYAIAPALAIRNLLNKHNLILDHLGVIEIHEAYAAQVLLCAKKLKLNPKRINKWGGAIALGHPFGATGIRLLLTTSHQLTQSDSNFAVVAICVGAGQALAALLTKPAP